MFWPDTKTESTEYSVTGLDGGHFARGGDSGAIVLDQHNRVVGVVVGGPDSHRNYGDTYITAFSDILWGIAEQTQLSLTLAP